MKKSKSKDNRKALIVTEKQLEVIKNSCELYGRIQIGQFEQFAEIVTQTGFSGSNIRVSPKLKENETDVQYATRCYAEVVKDRLVCDCIKGAVEGIYRQAYCYNGKPRTNESSIALDVWSTLDGRREDGFHMGTEPLVQVKDWNEV